MIPANRIKVVKVHSAGSERRRAAPVESLDVVVQIEDESPVSTDQAAMAAQIERLDVIIDTIKNVSESGVLKETLNAEGYLLTSLELTPPAGKGLEESAAYMLSIDPPSSSSSGSVGLIAGIAAGAAVLVIIIVVIIVVVVTRSRRRLTRDIVVPFMGDSGTSRQPSIFRTMQELESSEMTDMTPRTSRVITQPTYDYLANVNPRYAQESSVADEKDRDMIYDNSAALGEDDPEYDMAFGTRDVVYDVCDGFTVRAANEPVYHFADPSLAEHADSLADSHEPVYDLAVGPVHRFAHSNRHSIVDVVYDFPQLREETI
jgi:hypothetical protein